MQISVNLIFNIFFFNLNLTIKKVCFLEKNNNSLEFAQHVSIYENICVCFLIYDSMTKLTKQKNSSLGTKLHL